MFGNAPRIIIDALIAADKLKSIDFGTVVDVLGEGQIEGSATASKAGITDKTSVAYNNAFLKDLFLNGNFVYSDLINLLLQFTAFFKAYE